MKYPQYQHILKINYQHLEAIGITMWRKMLVTLLNTYTSGFTKVLRKVIHK